MEYVCYKIWVWLTAIESQSGSDFPPHQHLLWLTAIESQLFNALMTDNIALLVLYDATKSGSVSLIESQLLNALRIIFAHSPLQDKIWLISLKCWKIKSSATPHIYEIFRINVNTQKLNCVRGTELETN